MKRGDVRGAAEAARRLGDPPAEGLRGVFFALLDQRGYFVKSAEQIAASLREILEVGPGFDLYELSAALAAAAGWPELAPFSRRTAQKRGDVSWRLRSSAGS